MKLGLRVLIGPVGAQSAKTVVEHLTALSAVCKYALIQVDGFDANPCREARDVIGASITRECNPIESPQAIDRLLKAARARSLRDYTLVLTLLDTGVRLGELAALRWSDLHFGRGEDDTARHVRIQRSRAGP